MSWHDRLRPAITLTAPDKTAFTAAWQGNDIEAGLMVGQFNAPLRDGTITQPLGGKGLSFPLTLSFEGDDHDTTSMAFLRAFQRQRGPWTVVHPVYGTLSLQGIGATLSADPTGSANLTVVQTQWVEVEPPDNSVSLAEIGQQTLAQVETANAASRAQFLAACDISNAESQEAAASSGLAGLGSIMASPLGRLAQGASDVNSAFTSAYAQVSSALAAIPMDIASVTSPIQTLLQLPAIVTADLSAKVQAFGAFCTSIQDALAAGSDANARNAAVVGELYLGAALSGAATASVLSLPSTREEAIAAISSLRDIFDSSTTALDAVQTAASGNIAVEHYFSNSTSYADLARLLALTVAYLLRTLFDLKVAKRFTLDRPRAPIEITITEYGTLGDGDVNLDLFNASNGLTGRDIIILPAGREVVVYA